MAIIVEDRPELTGFTQMILYFADNPQTDKLPTIKKF
jgi:hypothetical protein